MNGVLNLKKVKEIQKIELNFAAAYLLAIPYMTMYDEIQLEKPIYMPT